MIVLQRPPRAARSTRPSLERPMIPDSSAGPQSPMFQSSFKGALRIFQANAVLSTPLLPAHRSVGPQNRPFRAPDREPP
jgi:hypothetical protein